MTRSSGEMAAMSHVRMFLRQHARPTTLEALIEDIVDAEIGDTYAEDTVRGVLSELTGTDHRRAEAG